MVRADDRDERAWLAGAPVCPSLAPRRIAHLGVAAMVPPFEIVRTRLGGSYFLASLEGEGRVLVDGRWKACGPETAFLLAPSTLQAFHAATAAPWSFCWIRYQEVPGQSPLATSGTPVLARFDAEPLRLAILGLHAETSRARNAPAIESWIDLIERYVESFVRPAALDPRLAGVFAEIEADLAREWTTEEMARRAHVSGKHLERLSKRELGRTPRQQLMWLRMRRAAELLSASDRTIESVAAAVGYRNPFVFSRTFKRFLGWAPSRYPGREPRRDPSTREA